jgi:hypothetical protein
VRRALLLVCGCIVISPAWGQDRPDSALAVPPVDSVMAAGQYGWITIVTSPEGADVYRNKTYLGKTPIHRLASVEGKQILQLFHPSAATWNAVAITETLSVRRGEETRITLEVSHLQILGVVQPELLSPDKTPDLNSTTSNQERKKLWVGYVAGAAMIVSGMTAAYLKDQANKDFDTYVQTRDPGTLATTQRLDRQAGVALTITEVSLGVLLYLFLSE